MEKDNKTTKRLKSIFWFIIYSMPFIIYALTFILAMTNKSHIVLNQAALNPNEIDSFYSKIININTNVLTNVSSKFNFVNNSVIYTTIRNFIDLLIGSPSNASIETFICQILTWYVITMLIHIIVDFILILPNICKKFLRKGGLDNE